MTIYKNLLDEQGLARWFNAWLGLSEEDETGGKIAQGAIDVYDGTPGDVHARCCKKYLEGHEGFDHETDTPSDS